MITHLEAYERLLFSMLPTKVYRQKIGRMRHDTLRKVIRSSSSSSLHEDASAPAFPPSPSFPTPASAAGAPIAVIARSRRQRRRRACD